MDSFVDDFQAAGGSLITAAKGNRSSSVREACKKHGGFYLTSIGGTAANLAERMFGVRGDRIEEVLPVIARGGGR